MNRMRRNWTAKEDALLRDLVQKELDNARPLLWRELAKHIPGRSNKDCCSLCRRATAVRPTVRSK
ncbi:hypothetical protein QBC46DRAFT_374341 [Diplogelasinospora grovesii]|uniref:Myb-like domain-containing protein n=1 Tax=Diplogelasinospora grovesii TaxID=303347 RepID=A0AAN6NER6_9PEZI|nr:hypothetical protein QBC46DRAFT_374341 [Diplogelasinospora grovesii]